MTNAQFETNAEAIIKQAEAKSVFIGTAESCTGGMIIASLTDIAGSSAVVDRGFITYSNQAKSELLDVAPELITAHGAVSSEVTSAMAEGAALRISPSDHAIAVSVSGVAGPGGGSTAKPVGFVWFGLTHRHNGSLNTITMNMQFEGDRAEVRHAATMHALALIDGKLNEI